MRGDNRRESLYLFDCIWELLANSLILTPIFGYGVFIRSNQLFSLNNRVNYQKLDKNTRLIRSGFIDEYNLWKTIFVNINITTTSTFFNQLIL